MNRYLVAALAIVLWALLSRSTSLALLAQGESGPTLYLPFTSSDGAAEGQVRASAGEVVVTVDGARPEGVSAMYMGATHIQYSLDASGDAAAVARGRALIQRATDFQNQHIMGWGAGNPEPSPGVYNWGSLDRRVQLMRDTGATPILTLCCAPGWMRAAGFEADWQYLEKAPDPSHVQDYADLAVAVALRYPDVQYFQVWNEFKGMWGTDAGCSPTACGQSRWDYERYTTLYNAIYDAVKAVRPDARIGGPYIVMATHGVPTAYTGVITGPYGAMDTRVLDAITYWLANKHGADFIALDAGTRPKDDVWLTDEYSAAQKFIDIAVWLRQQPYGAATLPLIWSEWIGRPREMDNNLAHYNSVVANALIYTLKAGSMLPLHWGPQGDADGFGRPLALFTDTRVVDGGQPTPLQTTFEHFRAAFPPGTQWVQVTVSAPAELVALASAVKTLLVNKTPGELRVLVNAVPLTLAAYAVQVIDTPPLAADTPTPTATATATPTPTATATATDTPVPPTATPAATATPTPPAVDTSPPTVAILSPVDLATVPRATIVTIQVSAADDRGVTRVEFVVDKSLQCTVLAAPYTCDWPTPGKKNARYTLTATAFDAAGNQSTHRITVVTDSSR